MPEYLAPGVFVEETSFRSKSIEGVSTSTAAFVGMTGRGPATTSAGNAPTLLTRFSDFERIYGGFEDLWISGEAKVNHIAHAARVFFDNGGGRLYVARVMGTGAVAAKSRTLLEALGVNQPAPGAKVVFEGRTPGGAILAGTSDVNMRVTLRLVDQPTTQKVARSQPRGSMFRVPDSSGGTQSYFVADAGNFTRASGNGTFPIETDVTTPISIVTLAVTVEDASGQIVEYQGLGLHPAHPRPAQGILGGAPPQMSDALSNPVMLSITDGDALTLITQLVAAQVPDAALVAANNLVTSTEAAAVAAEAGPATNNAERAAIAAARKAADDAKVALATLINNAGPYKEPVITLPLKGGSDGSGPPTSEAYADALAKLGALEDISIIASPDSQNFNAAHGLMVNNALVVAAEKARAYRIAVLDTPAGLEVGAVREIKGKIDSTHAALYYPWVMAANPLFGVVPNQPGQVALPPSGFVCGIYARTDVERGVWKAPANESILGAMGLQRDVSYGEQEVLNPAGVNCLRLMPNRGYRVWGARTTSSDPEWKYVNIRRYFLYLEASIDRGMQWAVFEPNGERLWVNVRQTVEDFLYNEWVNGALLGSTPKEAFFVRCDRSTITQNDLDNGRLVCTIGVAAIKPAEFVIFRIGQKTVDAKR
jgi:uncharacterized protein